MSSAFFSISSNMLPSPTTTTTTTLTSTDASPPQASVREGKCSFLVPRKNRLCTGTVLQRLGGDGVFCAIHRPDAARRVRCPVDPRHDVKESDVESHVVKCRAAQARLRATVSPYFRENASVPTSSRTTASTGATTKLRNLCANDGHHFLEWVESQHRRLRETLWWQASTSHAAPDALQQHVAGLRELDAYVAVGDLKHRQQQSILCSLLLNRAVNGASLTSVLEVGAGKGGVGCALKLTRPDVAVTLVERATFSVHKEKEMNKQLRHQQQGLQPQDDLQSASGTMPCTIPMMERVSLDAKDFDAAVWWRDECLRRTSQSTHGSRPAMCCGVVGKHLCGGCSDFALRMAEVIAAPTTPSERKRPRLSAGESRDPDPDEIPAIASRSCVVLATCCHHLSTYESYLGADVMIDELSTPPLRLFPDAHHFDLVRSICSWAIIGGTDDQHSNDVARTDDDAGGDRDSGVHWLGRISRGRKVELGRMAKALIDAGRVRALQNTALFESVSYLQYIDASVSGECFAIVAQARGA
jgi:tRNA:m4X modification enzyme